MLVSSGYRITGPGHMNSMQAGTFSCSWRTRCWCSCARPRSKSAQCCLSTSSHAPCAALSLCKICKESLFTLAVTVTTKVDSVAVSQRSDDVPNCCLLFGPSAVVDHLNAFGNSIPLPRLNGRVSWRHVNLSALYAASNWLLFACWWWAN